MFEPSTASFTFSRQPQTLGPDLLVASLRVTISVSVPDGTSQGDIQLLVDDANWQVYYGDFINSLARAKSFSINTCSSHEGRQYVEAAFANLAEVSLPKIPSEVTVEGAANGSRVIKAVSGYEAWLSVHAEFWASDVKCAEDTLVWAIRSHYFEELLDRAILAQHDSMTFSAAHYEAVADKFEPVFDSTRIRVPFKRVNY